MAKALEVNENSVDGKPAPSPSQARKGSSGGKRDDYKISGKSLQVNENSVGDRKPDRS